MLCPNCRFSNPDGAKFCSNCGTPLSTPRSVEGERRVVTVLFADVVGSTALAERVDPEVWAELMNGALTFMIAAVNRYEGTVGRLMGDAILALFGAPQAHEDDATRAVLAALDIRAAAAEYAVALKRDHGLEFAVRVGINTGLSVVTTVGDDTKAEYTAMGDSANVAARLQGLAPPQGILIGPDTYAQVKDAFETSKREDERIRGRAEPVATYEVLRPKPEVEAGTGFASVGSPFVGRRAELEALRDLVAAADHGQGRLAFLVGEAGLGKSRLLAELKNRADGRALWLEAKGIPYQRTSPYYLWRQLLQSPAMAGLGMPALTGVLAQLVGGGDAHADSAGASPLDAERFSNEVALTVAEHLQELARNRTVVVAFEDLHWADSASVKLQESSSLALQDGRVLFLSLSRPDHHSAAWDLLARAEAGNVAGLARPAVYLKVMALDRGDSRALLNSILDVEGMPEALVTRILAKADGNPFFLEEVLKSLIDSGHVVNEGGAWRATSGIDAVSVPNTISGVLSARIDRLPESTREVVQTAAVIGREFGSGILGAVLQGVDEPLVIDPQPHLRTLTNEDLINHLLRVTKDYRFKHELTRDAAYQRLLLRRRREIHARVAQELEARSDEDPTERSKELAYHYLQGEQWLAGARHSIAAARQAVRLYAIPEALELFETALSALGKLNLAPDAAPAPPSSAASEPHTGTDARTEPLELEVDAAVGWVNAAIIRRLHEDPTSRRALIARAEVAVATARRLHDERRLVTALVALGNVHVLSGFPGAGFGPLGEANDLAVKLGDEHHFLLPFWAATERMVDNEPVAAVSQFETVIELARKVGNKAIEAHALGTRAAALARLGRFAQAHESGRLALEAAEESGSIIKLADVNALVGEAYLDMGLVDVGGEHTKGLVDLGVKHTKLGAELALSVNGLECASAALHVTGVGELQRQHLPAAGNNLNRSIEYGTGTAYEPSLHRVRIGLANLVFLDGDSAAAVEAIERELDKAEAVHDDFGAATGSLALAEALLARGEAGRAEAHVIKAAEWFRERSMAPYLARALSLLTKVEGELGKEPARGAAEHEAQELVAALQEALSELREHFSATPTSRSGAASRHGGV